VNPADAEQLIFDWCTREARGAESARILASIYILCHVADDLRLLSLGDPRAFDARQRKWADALIQGCIQEGFNVPHERVLKLKDIYGLGHLERGIRAAHEWKPSVSQKAGSTNSR
jgi:hypothetical protein